MYWHNSFGPIQNLPVGFEMMPIMNKCILRLQCFGKRLVINVRPFLNYLMRDINLLLWQISNKIASNPLGLWQIFSSIYFAFFFISTPQKCPYHINGMETPHLASSSVCFLPIISTWSRTQRRLILFPYLTDSACPDSLKFKFVRVNRLNRDRTISSNWSWIQYNIR